MDSVFSHIVRSRLSNEREDVATESLAFILRGSELAGNGLMKLLRGLDSELPNLCFLTQQSERKEDDGDIRPDMCGFDGSTRRVYIENKFDAALTENQPIAYLESLAKTGKSTVLLFVAPEDRQQVLWSELSAHLRNADISVEAEEPPPGIVYCARTALAPIMALTSWPKLLSALAYEIDREARAKSDLEQLRHLCDATEQTAFVAFSAEGMSDQRTPALILQLCTIIYDAIGKAINEGVISKVRRRLDGTTSSVNQKVYSQQRIGGYLWLPGGCGVETLLSLDFGRWARYGRTPVWLVWGTDPAFGRALEVKQLLEPWAATRNLPCCMERGFFVLGLDIAVGDDKDRVVESLVADLRAIGTVLSNLPPI